MAEAPAASTAAADSSAAPAADARAEPEPGGSAAARTSPKVERGEGFKLPDGKPDATATAPAPGGPEAADGDRWGKSKSTMLAAVAFDLEGKLSADEVRKTIDDSRDKFSRCLNGDASVTVKAKVSSSGALTEVSVPSSVPDDAKLRDCVASVLKTLTFPKPKGFEPAGLRLDLSLKKQLSY
jgi:hypothetical protein